MNKRNVKIMKTPNNLLIDSKPSKAKYRIAD